MPRTRTARSRTKTRRAPRTPAGAPIERAEKAAARGAQSPFADMGSEGWIAYSGYVATNESNAKLHGPRKFQTYAECMKNTVSVATGVRYYLNLGNKPSWHYEPPDESSEAAEIADYFAEMFDDMRTPWRNVIRKKLMSKVLGFALGLWTAKVREDGKIGLLDIGARPQWTIEQFFADAEGQLTGFGQRIPATGNTVILPRGRCTYLVDDALSNTPEGTGLLRHVIAAAERLTRLEQLEGWGYETDMRGVPLIHAPLGALRRAQAAKPGTPEHMTEAQAAAAIAPLRRFQEHHIKGHNNGLLIDSEPFRDKEGNPTAAKRFSVELLRGDSTAQVPLRAAINGINHEIARVLGAEGLMIGEGSSGNRSTSAEKAKLAQLAVEGVLEEIAAVVRRDMIEPIGALNGWKRELLPWPHTDSLQMRNIEEVAAAMRDLASAGVTITRNDEAVGQLFDNLGLERLSLEDEEAMQDPPIDVRSPKEPPPAEDDEDDEPDLDAKEAA